MKHNTTKWQILAASLLLLNVVACSTNKNPSPEDPFEGLNRKIYAFNHVVDRAFIKPVAKTYDFFMPDPAQKGVTHFFNNLGEVPNVANDILQANVQWALVDTWRFVLNSTIGVAGLFDMASIMGLPRHKQDFGVTLTKWGYKNSAYIVLPILGPSTIRDTISIPANIYTNVISYVRPIRDAIAIKVFNVINTRANLLDTDKLVDEAFDPYIFVRDAYLQNRAYKSNHNNNLDTQNGNDVAQNNQDQNNQEQTKNNNDNNNGITKNKLNQDQAKTTPQKTTKEKEAEKHNERLNEDFVPYSPFRT